MSFYPSSTTSSTPCSVNLHNNHSIATRRSSYTPYHTTNFIGTTGATQSVKLSPSDQCDMMHPFMPPGRDSVPPAPTNLSPLNFVAVGQEGDCRKCVGENRFRFNPYGYFSPQSIAAHSMDDAAFHPQSPFCSSPSTGRSSSHDIRLSQQNINKARTSTLSSKSATPPSITFTTPSSPFIGSISSEDEQAVTMMNVGTAAVTPSSAGIHSNEHFKCASLPPQPGMTTQAAKKIPAPSRHNVLGLFADPRPNCSSSFIASSPSTATLSAAVPVKKERAPASNVESTSHHLPPALARRHVSISSMPSETASASFSLSSFPAIHIARIHLNKMKEEKAVNVATKHASKMASLCDSVEFVGACASGDRPIAGATVNVPAQTARDGKTERNDDQPVMTVYWKPKTRQDSMGEEEERQQQTDFLRLQQRVQQKCHCAISFACLEQ